MRNEKLCIPKEKQQKSNQNRMRKKKKKWEGNFQNEDKQGAKERREGNLMNK
jgi:hypothetical protein